MRAARPYAFGFSASAPASPAQRLLTCGLGVSLVTPLSFGRPLLPLHSTISRCYQRATPGRELLSPLLAPKQASTNNRSPSVSDVEALILDELASSTSLDGLTSVYRRRHASFTPDCALTLFRQATVLIGASGAPFSTAYRRLKEYMARELTIGAGRGVDVPALVEVARCLHRTREGDLRVWDAFAAAWNAAVRAGELRGDRVWPTLAAEVLVLGASVASRAQSGRFDPLHALTSPQRREASSSGEAPVDKDGEAAAHHISPWLCPADASSHAEAMHRTTGVPPAALPPASSGALPSPVSLWCASGALTDMYAGLVRVLTSEIVAASGIDTSYRTLSGLGVVLSSVADHESFVAAVLEAQGAARVQARARPSYHPERGDPHSAEDRIWGSRSPIAASDSGAMDGHTRSTRVTGGDADSGEFNLLDELMGSLLAHQQQPEPSARGTIEEAVGSSSSGARTDGHSIGTGSDGVASTASATQGTAPLNEPLSSLPPSPALSASLELADACIARFSADSAGAQWAPRLAAAYTRRWRHASEPLASTLGSAASYPSNAVASVSAVSGTPSVASDIDLVSSVPRGLSSAASVSFEAAMNAPAPANWAPGMLGVLARRITIDRPLAADAGGGGPVARVDPASLALLVDVCVPLRAWCAGLQGWAKAYNHLGGDALRAKAQGEALKAAVGSLRAADDLLVPLVTAWGAVSSRRASAAAAGTGSVDAAALHAAEAALSSTAQQLLLALAEALPSAGTAAGQVSSANGGAGAAPRWSLWATHLERPRLAQLAWAVSRATSLLTGAGADGAPTASAQSFAASLLARKSLSLLTDIAQAALACERHPPRNSLLRLGPLDPSVLSPATAPQLLAPAVHAGDLTHADLAALSSITATLVSAGVDVCSLPLPAGTPLLPDAMTSAAEDNNLLAYVSRLHALALTARLSTTAGSLAALPRVAAALAIDEVSRLARLIAAPTPAGAKEGDSAAQSVAAQSYDSEAPVPTPALGASPVPVPVPPEVASEAVRLLQTAEGEVASHGRASSESVRALSSLLSSHPRSGLHALLDAMEWPRLAQRGVRVSAWVQVQVPASQVQARSAAGARSGPLDGASSGPDASVPRNSHPVEVLPLEVRGHGWESGQHEGEHAEVGEGPLGDADGPASVGEGIAGDAELGAAVHESPTNSHGEAWFVGIGVQPLRREESVRGAVGRLLPVHVRAAWAEWDARAGALALPATFSADADALREVAALGSAAASPPLPDGSGDANAPQRSRLAAFPGSGRAPLVSARASTGHRHMSSWTHRSHGSSGGEPDRGDDEDISASETVEVEGSALPIQPQQPRRVGSTARMALSAGRLPRRFSPARAAAAAGAASSDDEGAGQLSATGSASSRFDGPGNSGSASDSDRGSDEEAPGPSGSDRQPRGSAHRYGSGSLSSSDGDSDRETGATSIRLRPVSDLGQAGTSAPQRAAPHAPAALLQSASAPGTSSPSLLLTSMHRASLVPFVTLLANLASGEAVVGGSKQAAASTAAAAAAATKHLATLSAALLPLDPTCVPLPHAARLERLLLPALGAADAGGGAQALRAALGRLETSTSTSTTS